MYQGTLDHFSEKTRDRFFLRMCGGRIGLQHYPMPQRSVTDQQKELAALQSAVQQRGNTHRYFVGPSSQSRT
ncbi:hypothetical protein [Persicobacter sp. CCB-QB2]|uniref:hypothetical protein n=1 Tax=Persicobacter sp. CCB-QB2 TaxID=1561025 RepID=UPI003460C891